MRKSVLVTCVLSGLFLPGCDYIAGQVITLSAETTYKPEETNVSLLSDFEAVTEVVANYAISEGFVETISERKQFQRVYQKSPGGNRTFRLRVSASPQDDVIAIVVIEMMQTRRPTEKLSEMYTELAERLKAKFGDRIRTRGNRDPIGGIEGHQLSSPGQKAVAIGCDCHMVQCAIQTDRIIRGLKTVGKQPTLRNYRS